VWSGGPSSVIDLGCDPSVLPTPEFGRPDGATFGAKYGR